MIKILALSMILVCMSFAWAESYTFSAEERYYYEKLKEMGITVQIFSSENTCREAYFEEMLKRQKERGWLE